MNKYLKGFLLYALCGVAGAILLLIIMTGITYALIEWWGIIPQAAPGFSFIWVNWEMNAMFLLVLAGVVWLIYRFVNFVEKKEVKANE